MTWRINDARMEDHLEIADLEQAAFGDRSWSREGVLGALGDDAIDSIVIRGMTPKICGFAITRFVSDEGEILSIGVMPAERRGGVGAALLRHVIDEADRRGARRMFLEVDAGNLPALALYRAFRFEEIGRRLQYYRDGADALILGRSV